MSYKAFAALKEQVEIEVIERMSSKDINAMLNEQREKINELEQKLLFLVENDSINDASIEKEVMIMLTNNENKE
jgi:hypothetical protein